MKSFRQRAVEGLREGDRFAFTRIFTYQDISDFAQISGDYNPVHCDTRFAALRGMRAPIAHGLLTGSLLTEIGGQIGWLGTEVTLTFKRPVYAGEPLTCEWTITEVDERGRALAEVNVTNDEGVTVMEAFTRGILPGEAERQRLAEMLAEGDPTNHARGEYRNT